MKKLIGITSILLVAAVVILATVDFNRFGKENVYVQVGNPSYTDEDQLDSGEIMTSYWYELPAYNENGSAVKVVFSAQKELRQGAYLKLYVKGGNEVTSYDEVSLNEIPDKARESL
ncbi:YxeA family protein [Oceanobacillus sp. FSL K6-2867]|uniref:YxeA family protein n=1 Tax=Oceanobacillus sp. FSL K6-2867 TaxID=2954748 RepID=UPI0030DA5466